MLTAGVLHLEDALLVPGVLESIDQRGLNGEESPLGICWGARGGRGSVDDAVVATLYGCSIDGEVER